MVHWCSLIFILYLETGLSTRDLNYMAYTEKKTWERELNTASATQLGYLFWFFQFLTEAYLSNALVEEEEGLRPHQL